jgi:hypothetical protein
VSAYEFEEDLDIGSDVDLDDPMFDNQCRKMRERNCRSLRRAGIVERHVEVQNFGIRKFDIFMIPPSSLKVALVHSASQWHHADDEDSDSCDAVYSEGGFMGKLNDSKSCRCLVNDDFVMVIFDNHSLDSYGDVAKERDDEYDEATETVKRMRNLKELFLRKQEVQTTPKKRKRKLITKK